MNARTRTLEDPDPQQYRNNFLLLWTRLVVKGCAAVKTITPLGFMILSYCFHNNSKGITNFIYYFNRIPFHADCKFLKRKEPPYDGSCLCSNDLRTQYISVISVPAYLR